jgi:helix-turn-helix protein
VTPEQTSALSRRAVRFLGSAYAECPKTLRTARELGLTGWSFFVAGLGGALGDVHPDTVAAALGFIARDAVRDAWAAARQVQPVADIAAQNLAECCRWGSEKLDRFAEVEHLAGLTERATAAVDEAGMPLYAAWRAMSAQILSAEITAGARIAVHMKLLRHHRAAAHLIAVRATGLTPLEAILSSDEGEAGAVAFGWQAPYPAIGPLMRRRAYAEALTDRLAGAPFAAFPVADRAEFVKLADAAAELATTSSAELPQVAPKQRVTGSLIESAVPADP